MELIKNTDLDFSKAIVIDSTLIKTYRACQQKYNYFEIQHYVSSKRKAAPSFGIAMHEGIAQFRHSRKNDLKYPQALELGQAVLQQSYQKHMPPENQSEVMTDDRRSLTNAIRLYNGFCQHYEPLGYSYKYIETPFALYLGQIPTTDMMKDVIYVGIIDAIIESNGITYLSDIKSTAMNITENYLNGYQMDQGLIGYTIAARELLGIDTHHALVQCFWVQSPPKTKGKPLDEYYHTKALYYDDEQLAEWHNNTLQTVTEIEMKKLSGHWVMDYSSSCNMYNGCDYRSVCSLPFSSRQQRLEMDFKKAMWTPLEDERLSPIEGD
jgi:hypothetical protein